MSDIAYLPVDAATALAYCHTPGSGPTVIFLGGFRSDMTGTKARALEAFCIARGQGFIRFDYRGHGQSGGNFTDCTIGDWKADALRIIDSVTGPIVLVGSSMGGWLMLLAAIARPERVVGLVGIAAAPDFTEHLLWDAFTPEQQAELRDKGVIAIPNCYDDQEPYSIALNLIAESGEHLVLDREIPIDCPVHLIHGLKDEDVPWEFSMTINEKLRTKDVKTTLVEDGDHRLSSEKHLALITRVVGKMLDRLISDPTG